MRMFIVIKFKKGNNFIEPKIVFDTNSHDDAIDFANIMERNDKDEYLYRVARFV